MTDKRVERRLAAILAADVAGYSRLMSADEEGTLAALKSARTSLIEPKVAEHRGRIVKTTGDGILVEFPSAVDAARYALDIQRAYRASTIVCLTFDTGSTCPKLRTLVLCWIPGLGFRQPMKTRVSESGAT